MLVGAVNKDETVVPDECHSLNPTAKSSRLDLYGSKRGTQMCLRSVTCQRLLLTSLYKLDSDVFHCYKVIETTAKRNVT